MPTFTPPTQREVVVGGRGQFPRVGIDRGITVWRQSGTWHQQRNPYNGDLAQADVVATADLPAGESNKLLFLGGHVYPVSEAVGTLLTDAGYTVT